MAKAPEKDKKTTKPPRRSLLGRKVGMTQLYTDSGEWVPVTVIQAGPCTVLQVKSPERDGYAAVQVGFHETSKPRRKPQQAYLEKIGASPQRFVKEIPFVEPGALIDGGKKKGGGEEGGGEGEAGGGEGGVAPGARVGVGVFK